MWPKNGIVWPPESLLSESEPESGLDFFSWNLDREDSPNRIQAGQTRCSFPYRDEETVQWTLN
jgi:hypothetical protein